MASLRSGRRVSAVRVAAQILAAGREEVQCLSVVAEVAGAGLGIDAVAVLGWTRQSSPLGGTVAGVCACGEYFDVDHTGELCPNPGPMGLGQVLVHKTPGTIQFRKADYPWLARVRVRAQARGGGSAGAAVAANELIARAGASGGGYAESLIEVGALFDVETIVVGAGGTGGAGNSPGATGGASSFGGVVTGAGGSPGSDGMEPGTSNTTVDGVAAPGGGAGQLLITAKPSPVAVTSSTCITLSGDGTECAGSC
ncbi:hypothetical protein [Streptomyces sp. NPDC047985]|uniref:hypothetical protein n=1 Tax=Streptomyces sp. NPDC047985 TaxID=3155384 RepID=UPI0034121BE9